MPQTNSTSKPFTRMTFRGKQQQDGKQQGQEKKFLKFSQ